MQLIVNGETGTYPDGITIQELLDSLGVSNHPVAVELNRKIVPRDRLKEKQLRENDTVEIVTFVGGG